MVNLHSFQSSVLCGRHPSLTPQIASLMLRADRNDPVLMSLSVGDVHIARALEKMLIGYKNREYIADEVCPIVPVDKRFDFIFQLPAPTMQTLANVQIAGQRAKPNEAKYTIDHTNTYNVKDYGLVDFISKDEIANADPPLRPYDYSRRILQNMLELARESRVATLMTNNANYGPNHATLTGGSRWDTSTGDPVQDILNAIEACFVRPNVLFMGGQVWPKFRTNPNVTKYVLGRPSTKSGATPLVVDLDTVAQAFELDKVCIGRAKYNSAAEGATPVSSYLWGKSAGVVRVEPQPNPKETSVFAYTYRFGSQSIIPQVIPELLSGVRGGEFIKLSHSDDERAIGQDSTGWLYETVVS